MKSRLIDLSHTIEHGMITYKGLPAPVICDFLSREESKGKYSEGTEFHIGRIDMVTNTGTYIDCPFHRYADGLDLSEEPLERFAGIDAITIRADFATYGISVDTDRINSYDVGGKAVLINTNWSQFWRTEQYFENHSFLTEDAATYLRDRNVLLVGIDSHNIDDTRARSRPVHTILLRKDILIVEHLTNLDLLPDSGYLFSAVPPKIRGAGTFPVRAFAELTV